MSIWGEYITHQLLTFSFDVITAKILMILNIILKIFNARSIAT